MLASIGEIDYSVFALLIDAKSNRKLSTLDVKPKRRTQDNLECASGDPGRRAGHAHAARNRDHPEADDLRFRQAVPATSIGAFAILGSRSFIAARRISR